MMKPVVKLDPSKLLGFRLNVAASLQQDATGAANGKGGGPSRTEDWSDSAAMGSKIGGKVGSKPA